MNSHRTSVLLLYLVRPCGLFTGTATKYERQSLRSQIDSHRFTATNAVHHFRVLGGKQTGWSDYEATVAKPLGTEKMSLLCSAHPVA